MLRQWNECLTHIVALTTRNMSTIYQRSRRKPIENKKSSRQLFRKCTVMSSLESFIIYKCEAIKTPRLATCHRVPSCLIPSFSEKIREKDNSITKCKGSIPGLRKKRDLCSLELMANFITRLKQLRPATLIKIGCRPFLRL